LPSTWRGLQALVPLVLTLGVSGYPFLMPPPVGGFATPSANETAPERELFLRWMQVCPKKNKCPFSSSKLAVLCSSCNDILQLLWTPSAFKQKLHFV